MTIYINTFSPFFVSIRIQIFEFFVPEYKKSRRQMSSHPSRVRKTASKSGHVKALAKEGQRDTDTPITKTKPKTTESNRQQQSSLHGMSVPEIAIYFVISMIIYSAVIAWVRVSS
jgi:Flp pilus assembly protein TadB